MKIKTGRPVNRYCFECLDAASIEECFANGGVEGLREVVDSLRCDIEVLTRLADAIDAGKSYAFDEDRISTWWGWG